MNQGWRLLFGVTVSLLIAACDGGNPSDPDAGAYHTYAELETEIPQLASAHSDIAQTVVLGKSLQARNIRAIKISDNVAQDEDEPEVILLGCHHAREWISVDVPFLIAKHLVENYAMNPALKQLVDSAEIWIAPMTNPDGHQYSVTSNRMWRKNRRNNGDGSYGVDLNRNYGYKWGGTGSSGDSYSETYRGPSAFSEPETQVLKQFMEQRRPRALITYHSYSQLVLYPWGHTYADPPDEALLRNMAVTMANRIRGVHSVSYTPQHGSDLYLTSGDTTDWLYGVYGVPAFTIELRPRSSSPGFVLPESQITPTFEENLPAALYLVEWAIGQGA